MTDNITFPKTVMHRTNKRNNVNVISPIVDVNQAEDDDDGNDNGKHNA